MAYGRLEVYWPDGRLESYLLEADTVSVGRAEGNTIALDTDTISRYHFSLVRNGDEVSITDLDSANGTFVDGSLLKSNEAYAMGDVEEILVGSLRIIFRQVDESTTLITPHADEETQRIEREEGAVRLELDYSRLKVWPASSSSTELSITNTGKETRSYSIQVSGMPSAWLRLTRPEIELDPQETAYVLLNIKPPRRPNTVPQSYQLTVEVAPVDQASLAVHAFIEVEIRAYSGFGMAVGQQAYENDPVPIFLHNQGSGSLQIVLHAKDPQNTLRFNLPKAPLELQAGQRLRVDLSVEAKNAPLTGTSKTYPFTVQVKSLDASGFTAASDAIVKLAPRFPIWGVMAAVGIALSVLIIAFLAVLGVLNPPEPIINTISLNAEQIAQGDMLEINVDAENVDSFDVLVNQTVVQADLPGDQTSFALDTSNLSGAIEVSVIGRNGALSANAQANSFVYVSAAIRSFIVEPDPLVRYTVNTLTISWDVPGASFVRINGLGEFTNNLVQGSTEYPSTHILEGIGGIPNDNLVLSLYAEDEIGTPIETSLTITVIDPQCTALSDIILHEGPDARYQQVATVPRDRVVVVTAQDTQAAWLRVKLEGGLSGWGEKEAFSCAQNFSHDNLRIESNVPPLPTETSSPSPEPSFTPSPTRQGSTERMTAMPPVATTTPASALATPNNGG